MGLGVVVGAFSGLLGVGGGVIMIPALMFFFHMGRKAAHATSLVALSVISVAGTLSFAVRGHVIWVAAGTLALGGIVGGQIGAYLLHRISERWLTVAFGILLIIVGILLAIGIKSPNSNASQDFSAHQTILHLSTGLVAGTLGGMLGVGGGVVIIPALVFFSGFSQHSAEGTSLAAIGPIALLAAIQLTINPASYPDWKRGLRLGVGGMLGAPLGAFLALQLPAAILQRIFAVVIIAIAIHLLWTQFKSEPPSEPA